jgi:DNA-binding NarL/FixJ family response regulator
MFRSASLCVVHSSPLYGECLSAVLRQTMNEAVEVVDPLGADVIDRVLSAPRQLLLLGLMLPNAMAYELVQRCARLSRTLVLVPRQPVHKAQVFQCVTAGADGLFLEDGSLRELLDAVSRVQQGERYISPEIIELVFDELAQGKEESRRTTSNRPTLTRRESEVIGLLAQRLTNREIAARLCVSPYTVKNHVHNILDKLQLSSRHAAVEYAVQNQLLLHTPLTRQNGGAALGAAGR